MLLNTLIRLIKENLPTIFKDQCPNCGKTKYSLYSIEMCKKEYSGLLKKHDKCKYGVLLKCPKCNSHWFKGKDSTLIEFVSSTHFSEWNNRNLFAEKHILKKLMAIGPTPIDIYGNNKGYISIPCKCTTKAGQTIDFCIVSLQESPPSHYQSNANVLFINDIADIQPSEFALSKEVRTKTAMAEEIRMCFSPTKVCGPNGEIFILNGINYFFDGYGYKGQDITLPEDEHQISEKDCIYYNAGNNMQTAWVIADSVEQVDYQVTYDGATYQATVICSKYWEYALYDLGDKLILDIVHDGIATYKSTFVLNETEENAFKHSGLCYITKLVKEIQNKGSIANERNLRDRFKSDLLGI